MDILHIQLHLIHQDYLELVKKDSGSDESNTLAKYSLLLKDKYELDEELMGDVLVSLSLLPQGNYSYIVCLD